MGDCAEEFLIQVDHFLLEEMQIRMPRILDQMQIRLIPSLAQGAVEHLALFRGHYGIGGSMGDEGRRQLSPCLNGMDKAAICDAPAMLMDLAPTILELTGTSYDATAMDACSLVPLLKGEDVSLRVAQISELRNMMMVFDGRYKWIRNWNDSDELYDLEQDPDEMHNIIKDHPDIIKRLTTYTFTH